MAVCSRWRHNTGTPVFAPLGYSMRNAGHLSCVAWNSLRTLSMHKNWSWMAFFFSSFVSRFLQRHAFCDRMAFWILCSMSNLMGKKKKHNGIAAAAFGPGWPVSNSRAVAPWCDLVTIRQPGCIFLSQCNTFFFCLLVLLTFKGRWWVCAHVQKTSDFFWTA